MAGKRTVLFLLLVLGALLLVLPGAAPAQRLDGDSRSSVKDPSGAMVPGARVKITNESTALVRETETTDAGVFVANHLLPGRYSITVEASGFKKVVRSGVEVIANR